MVRYFMGIFHGWFIASLVLGIWYHFDTDYTALCGASGILAMLATAALMDT